jgi:hypothetical protein
MVDAISKDQRDKLGQILQNLFLHLAPVNYKFTVIIWSNPKIHKQKFIFFVSYEWAQQHARQGVVVVV